MVEVVEKTMFVRGLKPAQNWLIAVGVLLGVTFGVLIARADTPAQNRTEPESAATDGVMPDAKRLFALGMIETGNDDREVGGAGEISRYQIHPVVWKSYSKSSDYRNPEISLEVARQHWVYLANYFKQKTGREPDDFDMYVLWNTRFGYYTKKGFVQDRVSAVIQDRAQRFVNLVNRKNDSRPVR